MRTLRVPMFSVCTTMVFAIAGCSRPDTRTGGEPAVADTGGPLSHLSIIARELGIPCIAGCKNATALIPDGARVHVDADAGTVTILD